MSGRSSFLRSLKKLPRNGRTAALHALLLADSGLSAQEALADACQGRWGRAARLLQSCPNRNGICVLNWSTVVCARNPYCVSFGPGVAQTGALAASLAAHP